MAALWLPLKVLSQLNTIVLRIGRQFAWICLALMVLSIVLQVFFRYVVGNALPWSEEAARFLMLWMTGIVAPSAYRWGGFVAIDMLPRALGRVPAHILNLAILAFALLVLIVGIKIGYSEVTGFGGKFKSPSLKLPPEWFGKAIAMPKAYMFASLWICCILMTLVNIELILRNIIGLIDSDADLPDDPDMIVAGAD